MHIIKQLKIMESLNNQMTEASLSTVGSISGSLANAAYYQYGSSEKYNINIEPLNRGFLVTVGCQRIAISSKEELKKNFNEYIDNPSEYTKKYNNNEVLIQE